MHAVSVGAGSPPVVLVHGLGCSHTDWRAQIVHLAGRHRVIAVDLPGHGASPAPPDECSVEQYASAVAGTIRASGLSGAVLVGHSMGCRVVIEAALHAPAEVAALVLVDGSRFAPEIRPYLEERLATEEGYRAVTERLFKDFFTGKTDRRIVEAITLRGRQMPRGVIGALLSKTPRYDAEQLPRSLARLRCPVMALQTTTSNERHERQSLRKGQSSPYLDMLRAVVPTLRVEIIEDTGHFPQIDEPVLTNDLIDDFLCSLRTADR